MYIFQPFSPAKELNVYNQHCEIVPNDEDWILILDYDCMILDPRAYTIIQKAIDAHPETQIFTAYASRIGYHFQRLTSGIDENDSILYHKAIAAIQAEEWPNGECNQIQTAAGFFLLFRKSYWLKNRFQSQIIDDSGRMFDWNFCMSAMRKNAISLIRGVYVWHSYRLGKENMRDSSHLI